MSSFTVAVSLTSLLPPPGGGSDKQFKDVLIVFCTFMAAVYCYLYDDRCYFGSDDFCGKGVTEHARVDVIMVCTDSMIDTLPNLWYTHMYM